MNRPKQQKTPTQRKRGYGQSILHMLHCTKSLFNGAHLNARSSKGVVHVYWTPKGDVFIPESALFVVLFGVVHPSRKGTIPVQMMYSPRGVWGGLIEGPNTF